jgi:hypothetical protein
MNRGRTAASKNRKSSNQEPKFLVMIHISVRGDIVQWFRELYQRCQEDRGFRELYLDSPMRALLAELCRDVWRSVPWEEFEPRFQAALQEGGDVKVESMRGPFDPDRVLELAKRIYNDQEFADAFAKDPVGFMHRDVSIRAMKRTCKVTAKHNWKCEAEVGAEHGFEW